MHTCKDCREDSCEDCMNSGEGGLCSGCQEWSCCNAMHTCKDCGEDSCEDCMNSGEGGLCSGCDSWACCSAVRACRDCSETQCEACLEGSEGFCTGCTNEVTIRSRLDLAKLRRSLDDDTLVAQASFSVGGGRIGVGEKLQSVGRKGRAVASMADVPTVDAFKCRPMRFVFAVPMQSDE